MIFDPGNSWIESDIQRRLEGPVRVGLMATLRAQWFETGGMSGNWGSEAMASFVEVCDLSAVPIDQGRGVTVADLPVALFRDPADPERVIALHGRCPHANGPMGRAWVDDGEAVCPLHRWRFDLRTGRCRTAPDRSLHRFRCEVRDGRVWVEA